MLGNPMWRNLQQLPRYRGLIQTLVARELKARYRGSVLGFVWSFINPLMLLLVYSFIFATIMPNPGEETKPYPLFFFCGLLPWTWFQASLTEAAGSLISGGNLIRKVLFPAEVLPIVAVLTNLVHFLLGLPILVLFLLAYRHYPTPLHVVWFPIIVLVQLIFTIGLSFALSALSVHFRDIRDILANLLQLWFFATPIIYFWKQPNILAYHWLMRWNPMLHLAVGYQEALFFGDGFGAWKGIVAVGALAIVVFLGGYWLFDRLRDSFAEAA
jgi:ABC-type polysaccharide/polyol phosphate export permease